MEVWGTPVLATIEEIINLARTEVRLQGLDLLRDVKPTNNNLMVTCIAHAGGTERHPSLGISMVDVVRGGKKYAAGTCNCFTCGYTVDLAEFISNLFGHEDKGMFGYKWITQNFVNLVIEKRQPLNLDMSRDKKAQAPQVTYVSDAELASYRFTHPYMYERKLTDYVIQYFDIGLCERTYSITFPLHDLNGRVVQIQRRSIEGKQFFNDAGALKGNYVYGLYHVYLNLSWITELYICESPIDALTCWVYGVPAVALMNAHATEQQLKLLEAVPIRKFVSALDNDEAGQAGTERLKKRLTTKMLYRLGFPDDVKDVNAMSYEEFLERHVAIF